MRSTPCGGPYRHDFDHRDICMRCGWPKIELAMYRLWPPPPPKPKPPPSLPGALSLAEGGGLAICEDEE